MRRSKTRLPALLMLLSPAVLVAGAQANLFYSNDFERNEPYAEWSSNQRYTDRDVFTQFLGRYTNDTVSLTLQAPPRPRDEVPGGGGAGGGGGGGTPAPSAYLLEFWFYAIDSWDGNDSVYGPDRFMVRVNNAAIFHESFANQHLWQSYNRSPDVGRAQLGFDGRWNDSIYYMALPFSTNDATLRFDFLAYGLHGAMNDESWGIDNIRVSTVPVPAPAGAGLLLAGACFAARRRR
jgi:hypothetical protein